MKPLYKSKEVWIGVLAIVNVIFSYFGMPSVEPTPELLSAIIGVLVAIRVLYTETKLSLK